MVRIAAFRYGILDHGEAEAQTVAANRVAFRSARVGPALRGRGSAFTPAGDAELSARAPRSVAADEKWFGSRDIAAPFRHTTKQIVQAPWICGITPYHSRFAIDIFAVRRWR